MEEKKKRRVSRRDYLNDFHQNIKGEYIYTGQLYSFKGSADEYRSYITVIITDAVLILGMTIASESFASVEMSRYPLTAFFWLLGLVTSSVLLYSAVRTAFGKNPMRAYIYLSSAKTLSGKALAAMAAAALSFLENTVFLLVRGIDGVLWLNLIRPVLSLSAGYVAFRMYSFLKTVVWEEIPNDGRDRVGPAEMPKL